MAEYSGNGTGAPDGWSAVGPHAAARLLPLVYGELRALAQHYMDGEPPGQTLQPTALVHEAYIRLVRVKRIGWNSRSHFLAMAATEMRRVLIERARRYGTRKRGSNPERVTLDDNLAVASRPSVDLLALDQALSRLATLSERQGRVAELRLFAGMTIAEVAEVLGVSERTVSEEWRVARVWLASELS